MELIRSLGAATETSDFNTMDLSQPTDVPGKEALKQNPVGRHALGYITHVRTEIETIKRRPRPPTLSGGLIGAHMRREKSLYI